ncbi:MAG TPA: hypothetical protein VFF73_09165 [Planctomycetota bacterium]|nr:hypothetical protein [Planctomycetota bacterium]
MTGRTKAKVAIVGLVLLVGGLGVPLASSEAARVRYWAWRMRSHDPETRQRARRTLFEIGRPAIDRVLPELVVEEVSERSLAERLREMNQGNRSIACFLGRSLGDANVSEELFAVDTWIAPLHFWLQLPPSITVWRRGSDLADDYQPIQHLLEANPSQRRLIVGPCFLHDQFVGRPFFEMPLSEDDPLAQYVVEALRARIFGG